MTENFSHLGKEMAVQIHEAQRVPNKSNPNRAIPRHIIIKLSSVTKNFRAPKQKREVTYKGIS